MVPTYHLSLSPATASEDVLGITEVSGFYGPGNWAAWLLTIVASWLAIYGDMNNQGLHVVAHVLYTNWAAVDLLRQITSIDLSKTVADTGHDNVSNSASVAAAFNVTYWGILQIALQYLYSLLISDWEPSAQRRCIMLLFGHLLPSATGVACLYSIHFDLNDLDIVHGYGEGSRLLPMLYYDDISQVRHQWNIFYASLIMAMTCAMACVSLGQLVWTRMVANTWKINWTLAVYTAMIMPLAIMFIFLDIIVYCLKNVWTGGKVVSKSCFFMPCAPQHVKRLGSILYTLCRIVCVHLRTWYSDFANDQKAERMDQVAVQAHVVRVP